MELGRLDRLARWVSPRWALNRMRHRAAFDLMARHYEAASVGRRTQGWRRTSTDANAALTGGLSRLRDHARDLVRNNPHAESALSTIVDHTVGWGIEGKAMPENRRVMDLWREWSETTACDADGRHNFAGLQRLAMRTIVESGEVLIRRRIRRLEDGFPIPLQVQVLEPDYLDSNLTGTISATSRLPNGGRIIHGVEFDAIGRRVAYWLYPEHPGSEDFTGSLSARRVPADGVLHVFRQQRPGQVRGPSWFAPVLLAMKDYDEYEDAQRMKQKIAACLTVLYTDADGSNLPLGTAIEQEDVTKPELDALEPGWIGRMPPGSDIKIVEPPSMGAEYKDFTDASLRSIATGLGVTFEDLTGNYQDMPFSAARMSRLRHWARVDGWRWQTLIPQLCDPVWNWTMEMAAMMNLIGDVPRVQWTAQPPPMIDPQAEGLAYQRNIRSGIMSYSEALRERGYDPKSVMEELAADFKMLDELELVLDSDPRKMTQAGQLQSAPTVEEPEPEPEPEEDDEDDEAATMLAIRKLNRRAKRKRTNGEAMA